MIKKYNFENLISNEDNLNCIKLIDGLFEEGNWCRDVPPYQTFPNLFDYPEFYKLKQSLLFSCFSYLGSEANILGIKSWCYRSDCITQQTQDREKLWHSHGDSHKLSGIYYLNNPKNVTNYEYSGTEFIDFPNIIPEDFSWFIFPSHLTHRPGIIQSPKKRYVLASDLSYTLL